MEKYGISKPITFPVGMRKFNDNADLSFQLNRLVNMDGCDASVAAEIGPTIKTENDFYDVLKLRADQELAKGNLENAAALYRMAEFYTDWEDPRGLEAWKKARELFHLKSAKSVTAREITEKEQGADHCYCGNQKLAMDTILLWVKGLRRRDES